MVHVVTASGPFHARVISARLGAAGILCEVRGGLDGPYPLAGCVDVLVPDDEAAEARALLAADAAEAALARQVEDAFGMPEDLAPVRGGPPLARVALLCLLCIVAVGLVAESAARLAGLV